MFQTVYVQIFKKSRNLVFVQKFVNPVKLFQSRLWFLAHFSIAMAINVHVDNLHVNDKLYKSLIQLYNNVITTIVLIPILGCRVKWNELEQVQQQPVKQTIICVHCTYLVNWRYHDHDRIPWRYHRYIDCYQISTIQQPLIKTALS